MANPNDTARPIAIDVDALNDRQRAVHDAILAGPRGIVEGPLRVWLLSPQLADHAQALGAFCRYGTRLSPDLSELGICVVGSYWQSGFEWHIHAPLALRAGVDAAALEAIRRRETPRLDGAQLAVFRFASVLLQRHHVDDETYALAIRHLGREGVVELVGILGYYGLICMTINAFRVPLPEGAVAPFAEGIAAPIEAPGGG